MKRLIIWGTASFLLHASLLLFVRKEAAPEISFAAGGSVPLNVETYRNQSTTGAPVAQGETTTQAASAQIEEGSALGIPPPEYPRLSRLRGEEGDVLLRLVVDPQLHLHSVEVLKPSGFPALDRAAVSRIEGSLAQAAPSTPKLERLVRFKFRLSDGKH